MLHWVVKLCINDYTVDHELIITLLSVILREQVRLLIADERLNDITKMGTPLLHKWVNWTAKFHLYQGL